MGQSLKFAMMQRRLAEAERGDIDAFYDLGIAFSSGSDGIAPDLVEAHKWFNLAAVRGSRAGQTSRAELALEMTARQIAEAQRQARAWLAGGHRIAA